LIQPPTISSFPPISQSNSISLYSPHSCPVVVARLPPHHAFRLLSLPGSSPLLWSLCSCRTGGAITGPAAPRPPLRAVKRPARARQLPLHKRRRHGPGAHHQSTTPPLSLVLFLFPRGLGARPAVASRHAFKASLGS
jgi:hypothetical protein